MRRSFAEVLRASMPKDKASYSVTEKDIQAWAMSPAKGCRDQALLTAKIVKAFPAKDNLQMTAPATLCFVEKRVSFRPKG
jgi:lipopolysaccharide export system protein LptC